MIFNVRRYQGADNPQNGYEKVEAESAREAAEQACGEPLTDRGKNADLRATVHTNPPQGRPQVFFATRRP